MFLLKLFLLSAAVRSSAVLRVTYKMAWLILSCGLSTINFIT